MKKLISLIITSIVGISSLMASNFNIDKTHTNVGFKVKHMMISNVNGKFNDFEGTYSIDNKTHKLTSLKGIVKIDSLSTQDADRDGHLKSDSFFNAQKYPNMTMELLKQTANEALIRLTIRDITKTVSMKVEDISDEITDPWGNIRTAFVLSGKINRIDFNMKFNKILDAGGVMVSNDVKIIIEAEGILVK